MGLDTFQERMSAIGVTLPFRAPAVDATEPGFDADDRAGVIGLFAANDWPGWPGTPSGRHQYPWLLFYGNQ